MSNIPHGIWLLINSYACVDKLYVLIPTLSKDDCTFKLVICTYIQSISYPFEECKKIVEEFDGDIKWGKVSNMCNTLPIHTLCTAIDNPRFPIGLDRLVSLYIEHCGNERLQLKFPSLKHLSLMCCHMNELEDPIYLPLLMSLVIQNSTIRILPPFSTNLLLKRIKIYNTSSHSRMPSFKHLPLLTELIKEHNRIPMLIFNHPVSELVMNMAV